MSKRKGMSADEKRERLLEVFHETSDVFQLKDIEKLGVKKGVIAQAIKDVLQSLVDDNLVCCEKIGISNYYWSFPSDASVKIINEETRVTAELASMKRRKTDVEAALAKERAGKQDSELRSQLLSSLNDWRQRVSALECELAKYKDNDPEAVEAMRQGTEVAKSAANRWLDNLNALSSWARRQFVGQEESLAHFFQENGFKDNLEYLD